MSESFELLLDELEANCKERGVTIYQYCLVRTPWEQAKLWRQSRAKLEVLGMVEKLIKLGAPFLSQCLSEVGPQPMGPRVTNSIPGLSWHQWGEAADYCPMGEDGKLNWDDEAGFEVLAEEAKALGLTSGAYWRFKDRPHVQSRSKGVLDVHSYKEIDHEMRRRFEGLKDQLQH